jgi:hypothetical protein
VTDGSSRAPRLIALILTTLRRSAEPAQETESILPLGTRGTGQQLLVEAPGIESTPQLSCNLLI